jgi:hypothetical protein
MLQHITHKIFTNDINAILWKNCYKMKSNKKTSGSPGADPPRAKKKSRLGDSPDVVVEACTTWKIRLIHIFVLISMIFGLMKLVVTEIHSFFPAFNGNSGTFGVPAVQRVGLVSDFLETNADLTLENEVTPAGRLLNSLPKLSPSEQ